MRKRQRVGGQTRKQKTPGDRKTLRDQKAWAEESGSFLREENAELQEKASDSRRSTGCRGGGQGGLAWPRR